MPTRTALEDFVVAQRQRGIRPVTVNTYIGATNAFCAWLPHEGHVAEHLKLSKLRVERRILAVLDDAQIRALIGSTSAIRSRGARPARRTRQGLQGRGSDRIAAM